MTLEEEFREKLQGHLSDEKTEVDVRIAVKIAEEFAIGFADWLETLPPSRKVSMWSKNGELKGLFTMDNEQLLEIFKKEKEL